MTRTQQNDVALDQQASRQIHVDVVPKRPLETDAGRLKMQMWIIPGAENQFDHRIGRQKFGFRLPSSKA